jgi:Gpi18-like mannosyltransferase
MFSEAEAKLKSVKDYVVKRDFILAIVIALCVIIVGVFIGEYNNKIVPVSTNPFARYTLEPGNKLSFMSNWDGLNYIRIATHGYGNVSDTNFFPLYPLAIHVVHWVISSPLYASLIVSWTSFIGIIYFYLKILKTLFKDDNVKAVKGLALLLLFPTAVLFIATYTESLFGFLALGAIYFALKKKYWTSACFALFMSATHITGIFVLVLLALIMWEQKAKSWQIISNTFVGSIGLLSFMFYLEQAYKKPLSFLTTQKSHGWLSHGYGNFVSSADYFSTIFIILIVLAIIYWWNKRRSFSVYSFCYLLIPIIGKQFGGFNRYVLMAFPVPLMLYGLTKKRPNLYNAILVVSAICWTYFLLQYAGGYVGG